MSGGKIQENDSKGGNIDHDKDNLNNCKRFENSYRYIDGSNTGFLPNTEPSFMCISAWYAGTPVGCNLGPNSRTPTFPCISNNNIGPVKSAEVEVNNLSAENTSMEYLYAEGSSYHYGIQHIPVPPTICEACSQRQSSADCANKFCRDCCLWLGGECPTHDVMPPEYADLYEFPLEE